MVPLSAAGCLDSSKEPIEASPGELLLPIAELPGDGWSNSGRVTNDHEEVYVQVYRWNDGTGDSQDRWEVGTMVYKLGEYEDIHGIDIDGLSTVEELQERFDELRQELQGEDGFRELDIADEGFAALSEVDEYNVVQAFFRDVNVIGRIQIVAPSERDAEAAPITDTLDQTEELASRKHQRWR